MLQLPQNISFLKFTPHVFAATSALQFAKVNHLAYQLLVGVWVNGQVHRCFSPLAKAAVGQAVLVREELGRLTNIVDKMRPKSLTLDSSA